METYIAVVEAVRWTDNGVDTANAILPVQAATEEDALEIAAAAASPNWPAFAGWRRPLVVTVVSMSTFEAQTPWTAERARAVRIGK